MDAGRSNRIAVEWLGDPVIRFFIGLSIFFLAFISPVRYHQGDSGLTLLTAQAIVEHGTLQVDAYCASPRVNCDNNYRVFEDNHHYYYYFPLGNALIFTPILFVIDFFGFHLDVLNHENYVQEMLAGISSWLIFFMLLKIADFYYPKNTSTLISTIFFFGTLLVSTLLSALWSHNFAVLFGCIALYLMLKESKKDIFLCAACLFIAYLCRPTLSLLAVFLLIYLSMTDFKKGIKLAAYLAAALTGFYFFCAYLYSTGLPPYYLPQRLSNTHLMHGILGNSFSPSRGLFIFCPFIACLLLFKPKNIFKHWWILGVLWPMSHFFIVARFPVWWGAMSFGPRLLVDCMPGVFLFCLSFWPNLQKNKVKLFLLTLSILFSVYVNTWQGRFHGNRARN